MQLFIFSALIFNNSLCHHAYSYVILILILAYGNSVIAKLCFGDMSRILKKFPHLEVITIS